MHSIFLHAKIIEPLIVYSGLPTSFRQGINVGRYTGCPIWIEQILKNYYDFLFLVLSEFTHVSIMKMQGRMYHNKKEDTVALF